MQLIFSAMSCKLLGERSEERNSCLPFHEIPKQSVPTESAVWGVSKWGECKWTAEDNLCEPIRARLEELKPRDRGNIKDALIAETAIKNNYILVTKDPRLRDATNQFGGQAITLDELLRSD